MRYQPYPDTYMHTHAFPLITRILGRRYARLDLARYLHCGSESRARVKETYGIDYRYC